MTNRRFTLHGGPATAGIESIDDLSELVEEPLPSQPYWEEARARAAALFGLDAPPLRNASTVGTLADQIQSNARAVRPTVLDLAKTLPDFYRRFNVERSTSARLKTLGSLVPLLEALDRSTHTDVIATLSQASIATSPQAMGTAAKRAGDVLGAFRQVNWQPIEALPLLTDHRTAAAEQLLGDLRQALDLDELAVPLAKRLHEVERAAVALHIQPPPPPPPPPAGWRVVAEDSSSATSPEGAKKALATALEQTVWGRETRVTVSWKIEERSE
jgi:hypothetical protein